MRILCVCDEGVSRSPTIASLLQYRGHETLSVGANTSTAETRRMLADWCDLAIFTDASQEPAFPTLTDEQVQLWPLRDVYPRPFNPLLQTVVKRLIVQKGL